MFNSKVQSGDDLEARKAKNSNKIYKFSRKGFFHLCSCFSSNSFPQIHSKTSSKVLNAVPSILSGPPSKEIKKFEVEQYIDKPVLEVFPQSTSETVSDQSKPESNSELSNTAESSTPEANYSSMVTMNSEPFSEISTASILKDNQLSFKIMTTINSKGKLPYPTLNCIPVVKSPFSPPLSPSPPPPPSSFSPSPETKEFKLVFLFPKAPSTVKSTSESSPRSQLGISRSRPLPACEDSDFSQDQSSESNFRSFDSNTTFTDSSFKMLSKTTSMDMMISQPQQLESSESRSSSGTQSSLLVFSFEELKMATNNFDSTKVLGQGGFGYVYYGLVEKKDTYQNELQVKIEVAVKQLNHEGFQGQKEWLSEVNCLESATHPHLVKLIGYCCEDIHRLLVYEYMPCGSLEGRLFNPIKGSSLTWKQRLRIALDAAMALEYLHEGSSIQIIFRDLKSANILLDENLRAKLSDFGLARSGPQDDKTHVSTLVVGTVGYSAPEYVLTGHLTSKSDVWSFGVVLLELVTGRRSLDPSRPVKERHLVTWIQQCITKSLSVLNRVVDPVIQGQHSKNSVEDIIALAMRCLNKSPKDRPKMSEVVRILTRLLESPDEHAPIDTQSNSIQDETDLESNFSDTSCVSKSISIKLPSGPKKDVAPLVALREKANAVRLKPVSDVPPLCKRDGAWDTFPLPKTVCPPHALNKSLASRRLQRTGNS